MRNVLFQNKDKDVYVKVLLERMVGCYFFTSTHFHTRNGIIMDPSETLDVPKIIGSPLCIAAEDAQKIFGRLKSLLQSGKTVTLSFHGVTMLIPLFFNVAVGQLYGSFSGEEIRSRLRVEGLCAEDRKLLKHTMENAEKYHANPDAYDAAWEMVVEGEI